MFDVALLQKSNQLKPPRFLIYGTSGVGKTTFGACGPKPILLRIEDSNGNLLHPRTQEPLVIDQTPLLDTYEKVNEVLDYLMDNEHDFRTLVIDSLAWLEPLIASHVCAANNWKSIESPGFGKGSVELESETRRFCDRVRAVSTARKMAVVFIAHCKTIRVEPPDQDPHSRFETKLDKKTGPVYQEAVDAILFATTLSTMIEAKDSKGNDVKRAHSNGTPMVYTQARPSHVAKNRYHMPLKMPLDWAAIAAFVTLDLPGSMKRFAEEHPDAYAEMELLKFQ